MRKISTPLLGWPMSGVRRRFTSAATKYESIITLLDLIDFQALSEHGFICVNSVGHITD